AVHRRPGGAGADRLGGAELCRGGRGHEYPDRHCPIAFAPSAAADSSMAGQRRQSHRTDPRPHEVSLMDELILLRELRPEPAPADLSRARDRLLAEIEAERPHQRRRVGVLAALALAAAVAAT